jgi:hypothetical protein
MNSKKIVVASLAIGALALALFQALQISKLREQVRVLQVQKEQQAVLNNQVEDLQKQRDDALNRLAAASSPVETAGKGSNEVLKLRGEVGRLRRENEDIGSSSGLSKVTSDPEKKEMLREQQKMGMTMIYKEFAKKANLSSEQTGQLNDMLADHIMENVENVTKVLREKSSPEQAEQVFSNQEAALLDKVRTLLGEDGVRQYQDYTKDLLSLLSSQQFKGMMTGTDEAKEEKSRQLYRLMQEETQKVLSSAGLPSDYQMVPMLNFRNIASEQQGEKSLKLLNDLYQQVSARFDTLLSPEEIEKFQEFKKIAINNNRNALTLNRDLMGPISK